MKSDEYLSGAAINQYKCAKCSSIISGCIKCSSATVCNKCVTGMGVSSDTHSCEFTCSTGYLSVNLDECVTNCWDKFWLINAEGHMCAVSCGEK